MPRLILREFLFYGSLFAASLTCLTFFRLWYFGYPLPNTFYAKVPPSLSYRLYEGVRYAASFFLSSRLACMAVIAGITLLFFDRCMARSTSEWLRTKTLPIQILAYTSVMILLPVLSGGDHFHMHRFMQPAWPFLSLLLAWLLVDLFGLLAARFPCLKKQSFCICLLLTLTLAGSIGQRQSWAYLQRFTSPLRIEFDIAEDNLLIGPKLNKLFRALEDKPSVGVIIAGGMARTYQGEVIDLMGLNNIAIAHNNGSRIGIRNHAAFEIPMFFQLTPDILPVNPNDTFFRNALKFLFDSPGFCHGWTYGKLSSRDDPGCAFETFAKNSFIERTRDVLHFDQTRHRMPDGRWIRIQSNLGSPGLNLSP